MNFISSLLEELNKTTLTLKDVAKIRHKRNLNKHEQKIKDIYKNSKTREEKILASLINSIYHHNRAFFLLSRKSLQELVENDPNFSKKTHISIDGSFYKEMIQKIMASSLFDIERPCSDKPAIFSVKQRDILEMLSIDNREMEKQYIQCLEYVQGYKKISKTYNKNVTFGNFGNKN